MMNLGGYIDTELVMTINISDFGIENGTIPFQNHPGYGIRKHIFDEIEDELLEIVEDMWGTKI